MAVDRQTSFVMPQEQELYPLEVRTGIYAGVWHVDRNLARTPSGIFKPYNEGLAVIQVYDAFQNDPALREAGFGLAPVSVLLYGIQHDERFYEMLIGTYQLTGSGVADSRFLGTPDITREGEELQYLGLRNDCPIAEIETQSGRVTKLDKTTLWGVGKKSKVESERPRHQHICIMLMVTDLLAWSSGPTASSTCTRAGVRWAGASTGVPGWQKGRIN